MKWKLFLFILLLSGLVLATDSLEIHNVDEKEDVIIHLKDDSSLEEVLDVDGLEAKSFIESIDAVVAEVDSEALESLKENSDVISIEYDLPIKAFLDKSVPLINATSVHNLWVESQHVIGSGSACIIDTGIAYNVTGFNCTTASFLNGSCDKVVGGIDYYEDDFDPMDDNGHGTHVSWIANSVAPGSKIVSVRILGGPDATGSFSDLSNALNFCLDKVDDYNISVVSMSLGTEPPFVFSNYCDDESLFLQSLASLADQLVAKGVVVLASSGNEGNTTHLPAPACISNVTAVAGSDDSDSFYLSSNRNPLVDFVAPGVNIESFWFDDTIIAKSGTSMSTPHIAGAVLLMQHFAELQFGKYLVSEILDSLKKTGVNVTDPVTGLNFSRIDVYSALEIPDGFWVSIDEPKNVTYNTSEIGLAYSTFGLIDSCWMNVNGMNQTCDEFNTTEGSNYLELFVNVSDSRVNSSLVYFSVDTVNPSLEINSPLNGSMITSNNVNLSIKTDASNCYYNLTNFVEFNCNEANFAPSYGSHNLGVFVYDSVNNTNSSLVSFSFAPELPVVSSITPADNLKIGINQYNFSCTAVGENIKEVSVYGDFGGSYDEEDTNLVSGINVESNFTLGLNNGVYSWSCAGKDIDNDLGFSSNRTLTVDLNAPVISLFSPNQSTNFISNPINFEYNVTDLTSIPKCELYIDGTKSREDTEVFKNIVQSFSDSLGNGDHSFFISCIDEVGHSVNSSTRTINVNVPQSSPSASPSVGASGGGGGGSPKETPLIEETPTEEEVIPNLELEQVEQVEKSSEDSAEENTNSITGLVTSDFAENLNGVGTVVGYVILSFAGVGLVVFGGARLLHHDWETDDVGMKMQAKMFIQDKYNWVKDKLKRKGPLDDEEPQF